MIMKEFDPSKRYMLPMSRLDDDERFEQLVVADEVTVNEKCHYVTFSKTNYRDKKIYIDRVLDLIYTTYIEVLDT